MPRSVTSSSSKSSAASSLSSQSRNSKRSSRTSQSPQSPTARRPSSRHSHRSIHSDRSDDTDRTERTHRRRRSTGASPTNARPDPQAGFERPFTPPPPCPSPPLDSDNEGGPTAPAAPSASEPQREFELPRRPRPATMEDDPTPEEEHGPAASAQAEYIEVIEPGTSTVYVWPAREGPPEALDSGHADTHAFRGGSEPMGRLRSLSAIPEDSGEDDTVRDHRPLPRDARRGGREASSHGSVPVRGPTQPRGFDYYRRTTPVAPSPSKLRENRVRTSSSGKETRYALLDPGRNRPASSAGTKSRSGDGVDGNSYMSGAAGSPDPFVARSHTARGARDAACYQGLSLEEYEQIARKVRKAHAGRASGYSGSSRRVRTTKIPGSQGSRGTKRWSSAATDTGTHSSRQTWTWQVNRNDTAPDVGGAAATIPATNTTTTRSKSKRPPRPSTTMFGLYWKRSMKKAASNQIYRKRYEALSDDTLKSGKTKVALGTKTSKKSKSAHAPSRASHGSARTVRTSFFFPPSSKGSRHRSHASSKRSINSGMTGSVGGSLPTRAKSTIRASSKQPPASVSPSAAGSSAPDISNSTFPDHYSAYARTTETVVIDEEPQPSSLSEKKLRKKSSRLESVASTVTSYMGGDQYARKSKKGSKTLSKGHKSRTSDSTTRSRSKA